MTGGNPGVIGTNWRDTLLARSVRTPYYRALLRSLVTFTDLKRLMNYKQLSSIIITSCKQMCMD